MHKKTPCRPRKLPPSIYACLRNNELVFESRSVSTFDFEGEIISQMAAFVVATKEPKCRWIPNLKCPKVKNTLHETGIRKGREKYGKIDTSMEK